MAWNYRKRIKIAPGIHINVSKSGISTSIGPKGASITMGTKGTYANTSIPGTGLYSRKRIKGTSSDSKYTTSNSSPNNGNNALGCRLVYGIFLIIAIVGISMNILSNPLSELAKDYYIDIWLLLVMTLALYFIFKPWLKKKDNYSKKSSVANKSSIILSSFTNVNFGYDYAIAKYKEEEKVAIEKSDNEIKQAKQELENTIDYNKKMFLQSIIDCTKTDRLTRLIYSYYYNIDKETDELDPLFETAARKVITTRKCNYTDFLDWFGYDLSIERQSLIEKQLKECGIIEQNFESSDLKIVISDIWELNSILKKANGKSLLPKEDKIRINEYLKARENEVIEIKSINKYLTDTPTNILESYQNFAKAYKSLINSQSIWEVLSMHDNTETKSSASTLINRRRIYGQYFNNYKFVQPSEETNAIFFDFKNIGISIYIYPEFVVITRANNFDIVPLSQFDIEYNKSNFVEESTILLPKDAKFVKFTYKHANRNGERDARYSDNPRYGVYEYGNLTFKPIDLTMQFSNSEVAENFVRAFLMLKQGTTTYIDPVFGISEKFFNNAKEITKTISSFYDKLSTNRTILRVVDGILPDKFGKPKEKLRCLFLSDIIKCYESLGHDATNLFTKEGIALVLVEENTVSECDVVFNTIQLPKFKSIVESISKINRMHKEVFLNDKDEDYFFINEVLKSVKQFELSTQYFSLLYRLFSVISKADCTITEKESAWLEKLMTYSQTTTNNPLEKFEKIAGLKKSTNNDSKQEKISDIESEEDDDPIKKLQNLIGLDEVKKEVTALANFVTIQKEREKKGLKAIGLSYHCIFTGNPGTGKTTVARILAEIYKNLGLIKKGHLVETDRSGLVAEYVGQTATKTNKIIDSALDGVLFIDEAYSLVQGGSNDYGNEAIATLLKRMEDDRNRLIVILAGYSNEMKDFINSNPGLQSRFNRYIHFADYNVDDLKNIFLINAQNSQYYLTQEATALLTETLTCAVERKDKNFGNGRYVRNLFEKALQNQAVRLSCQPQTSAEDLSTLTISDIPSNNK